MKDWRRCNKADGSADFGRLWREAMAELRQAQPHWLTASEIVTPTAPPKRRKKFIPSVVPDTLRELVEKG